jgi:hypothetical protein
VAFFSFEVATNSMVRVICRVFSTDLIRRLTSLPPAIAYSLSTTVV